MNPLINNGGNQPVMNFAQLYAQAMRNPKAFLSQLGVPEDITTPRGAVQYFLQQGKVNQAQINQAQKQAQDMVGQININQPI